VTHTVVNVSVWRDLAAARQMETLGAMLAQRPVLEAAGVAFDAIANLRTPLDDLSATLSPSRTMVARRSYESFVTPASVGASRNGQAATPPDLRRRARPAVPRPPSSRITRFRPAALLSPPLYRTYRAMPTMALGLQNRSAGASANVSPHVWLGRLAGHAHRRHERRPLHQGGPRQPSNLRRRTAGTRHGCPAERLSRDARDLRVTLATNSPPTRSCV
jgi:hypothetical protein